jgi:hypothetical protein
MSQDASVQMRAATTADEAFIVEMARHACIIEDWPLPDPDDEEVLSMLPPPGEVPIIAAGPCGRGTTIHRCRSMVLVRRCLNCASVLHRAGAVLVSVAGCWTHCSPSARRPWTRCAPNVHVRNPAQHLYQRKGFHVVGQGRGPLGLAMRKDLRSHRRWR